MLFALKLNMFSDNWQSTSGKYIKSVQWPEPSYSIIKQKKHYDSSVGSIHEALEYIPSLKQAMFAAINLLITDTNGPNQCVNIWHTEIKGTSTLQKQFRPQIELS